MRNIESSTINLAHPRPVLSDEIFQVFSQHFLLPMAPFADWLGKLDELASSASTANQLAQLAQDVPAAMILDFFHRGLRSEASAISDNTRDREIMGIPRLCMEKALKGSEALRNSQSLNSDDVRSWIAYWKEISFLPKV